MWKVNDDDGEKGISRRRERKKRKGKEREGKEGRGALTR